MLGRRPTLAVVCTTIEVTVLAVGWLLGGTAGIGTVLYAVSIGLLVQLLLPRFTLTDRSGSTRDGGPAHRADLADRT